MSKKKKTSNKKSKFTGKVTLKRAIRIFEALGFNTANKWGKEKLEKKIKNLPDLAEGANLSPKMQKRVNVIVNAINKNRKITVIDVEDIANDKEREKDINDAAKREAKRKAEKKADRARKEKRTEKKAAKKEKSKESDKKAVAAGKKKTKKSDGMIMTFYELIKSHGPISTKKLLSLLSKKFPTHNIKATTRNISGYSKYLANTKNIKDIVMDDKQRYYIKKKK